jgi:hypothetical protein
MNNGRMRFMEVILAIHPELRQRITIPNRAIGLNRYGWIMRTVPKKISDKITIITELFVAVRINVKNTSPPGVKTKSPISFCENRFLILGLISFDNGELSITNRYFFGVIKDCFWLDVGKHRFKIDILVENNLFDGGRMEGKLRLELFL